MSTPQSFPDTILNIRKSHTKIYNASKNEDPTHDDDDVDVQQPRLFSSFYSGGYTSTSPIEQARRIRRASHSLVASNLATKYPNIDTDEDAVRIIGERQAELFPPHLGLPRRLPARHRECQLGDAEMHQQALLDAQGCCEGWYQVEMRLEFRPRIQIDVVLPQDLPRELLTRRRPFILIDGIEGLHKKAGHMLSRSILMKEAKCNGVVFLAEVQADVGDDRSRYLEIFGDATFLPAWLRKCQFGLAGQWQYHTATHTAITLRHLAEQPQPLSHLETMMKEIARKDPLGPDVLLEDVQDVSLRASLRSAVRLASSAGVVSATLAGNASLSASHSLLEIPAVQRVFDRGLGAALEPEAYYANAARFWDPVQGKEVLHIFVIKPIAEGTDAQSVRRSLSLRSDDPVTSRNGSGGPTLHYFAHGGSSGTLTKDACCANTLIVATSGGRLSSCISVSYVLDGDQLRAVGSFESSVIPSTGSNAQDWSKALSPAIRTRFGLHVDTTPSSPLSLSFGLKPRPKPGRKEISKLNEEYVMREYGKLIAWLSTFEAFKLILAFPKYDEQLVTALSTWTGTGDDALGGLRPEETRAILKVLRRNLSDELRRLSQKRSREEDFSRIFANNKGPRTAKGSLRNVREM